MPDVSVVIVSWNVRDLLRECLTSILASPDVCLPGATLSANAVECEVIVVDSNSSDGTSAMILEEFPWVTLVEKKHNVGFSAGNNLGIAKSSGRQILFLNPDTRILGTAISTLARYLDKNANVGVVGPKLLNSNGSLQSSRRRFPRLITGVFESTSLEPIAPRKILRDFRMEDCAPDQTHEVDWLVGAAIMIRRTVLDEIGTFDERYFMYSEETDLQKRIKTASWKVIYLPEAQVIHHGGKSSDQVVAQRHISFETSKVKYFRKHHGRLTAEILRLVLFASYGWKMAIEVAKAGLGHKRSMRKERIQAYGKVIKSGLRG